MRDTLTVAHHGATEPLAGYRQALPVVFCGLYPVDSSQYPDLKEALGRLQLNDAALTYEPESSAALGFGYRCGFLGLLHLDIVQERLEGARVQPDADRDRAKRHLQSASDERRDG